MIHALLADGEFAIRALSRTPDSDAAQNWLKRGVDQIHFADLDDQDSLVTAFTGCYGVFVVTNYWSDHNVQREIQQHDHAAAAAQQANVHHVVLSTLEDTREIISPNDGFTKLDQGQYYVPHFDGKGEAAKRFRKLVPTTLLYTSFYYENFIHFGMGPQQTKEGTLALSLPMQDKKMLMNATEDIGKMVVVAFKDEQWINQSLYVASEALTMTKIAADFEHLLGKPVLFQPITHTSYSQLAFPGAKDLSNMFKFFTDFDVMLTTRNPDEVRKLIEVKPFATWLQEHKTAFVNA